MWSELKHLWFIVEKVTKWKKKFDDFMGIYYLEHNIFITRYEFWGQNNKFFSIFQISIFICCYFHNKSWVAIDLLVLSIAFQRLKSKFHHQINQMYLVNQKIGAGYTSYIPSFPVNVLWTWSVIHFHDDQSCIWFCKRTAFSYFTRFQHFFDNATQF